MVAVKVYSLERQRDDMRDVLLVVVSAVLRVDQLVEKMAVYWVEMTVVP